MPRFRSRRSIYFNFALLFLLAVVWCVSYAGPVLQSFFKEEHLFYGRVSYAAIPSVFGGSNVPFLDKTFFRINGDDSATFVLYASEEQLNLLFLKDSFCLLFPYLIKQFLNPLFYHQLI